jgi:hypothetical protein
MIGDLEIHLVHNTNGKIEYSEERRYKKDVHFRSLVLRLEKKGSEEMLNFGGYTGGEQRGL